MPAKSKSKRGSSARQKVQARKRPATKKTSAGSSNKAKKTAVDADPDKITPTQLRVLEAYRHCGSIAQAAKAAGSCRGTHYKALENSRRYRAAFDQAHEDFTDLLRETALHRAIKGVPRLKFYRGEVIMAPVLDEEGKPVIDGDGKPVLTPYIEYEVSDQLLIKLLQAHAPEFRDISLVQHHGPGDGTIRDEVRQNQAFIKDIMRFSAENLKHIKNEEPGG